MGGAVKLRSDYDAYRLRTLVRTSKSAKQVRRLLALAEVYDGKKRNDAARVGGVEAKTINKWVVRFNSLGPDGLLDYKPPGKPAILNDAHRHTLIAIARSNLSPDRQDFSKFTLSDFVERLQDEFGVSVSRATVGKELRKLGFGLKQKGRR